MASELLAALIEATLASSLAVILVLILRRPLRRWLGARIAYAAWGLIPLSVAAVWLPAPAAPPLATASSINALLPTLQFPGEVGASTFAPAILVAAWALGALALACVMLLRQRHFERGVRRRVEHPFDETEGASPAVTGLFKPRIALPLDFQSRYLPEEQRLVIAHEQMHVERLDVPAQALASALRCLFWFNPLSHLAGRHFRFDQELACDAAVLSAFPASRRSYGEAMLKTQLAEFGLPLGCHWQASHPLKERIAMLKQPLPGALKRRTGTALLAAVLACASYAAWATQPATQPATPGSLQVLTNEDVLAPPKYPASAIAGKIGGRVLLDVLVGTDGRPKEIKIASSEPEGVFDKVAMEAAAKWEFNAGRNGATGQKVEGWVRVPVHFNPDGPPDGNEAD